MMMDAHTITQKANSCVTRQPDFRTAQKCFILFPYRHSITHYLN